MSMPAENYTGAPKGSALVDPFERNITYLRISITDRCNLRCIYCSPKDVGDRLAVNDLLTYKEIFRIAAIATDMGIRKIRLTGGEPLVRKDAVPFIARLATLKNLRDIRLTTNGVYLEKYAEQLYHSGVSCVNVSLDSLRPERFRQITGADFFARVWAGIQAALRLGFSSVKINMVVIRGVNDDEVESFARLTFDYPVQVRFIEFMPFGSDSVWDASRFLPLAEVRKRLESIAPCLPVSGAQHDGPARIHRFEGARGTLGFISPISEHFCSRCNRLRLTSSGKLRSCLLCDKETDVREMLRQSADDEKIRAVILQTIRSKPRQHELSAARKSTCHGPMSRIGG